jgi:hypothetical protein
MNKPPSTQHDTQRDVQLKRIAIDCDRIRCLVCLIVILFPQGGTCLSKEMFVF